MKSTSLLAAAVLLGGVTAEVHKLKLNKVPLSEQLVSYPSFSNTVLYIIQWTRMLTEMTEFTQHGLPCACSGSEVHGDL